MGVAWVLLGCCVRAAWVLRGLCLGVCLGACLGATWPWCCLVSARVLGAAWGLLGLGAASVLPGPCLSAAWSPSVYVLFLFSIMIAVHVPTSSAAWSKSVFVSFSFNIASAPSLFGSLAGLQCRRFCFVSVLSRSPHQAASQPNSLELMSRLNRFCLVFVIAGR